MKSLIEARQETGLCRERFGELIGMASQQLRAYELGLKRPEIRNARRLAVALGVGLNEVREFQHIVEREKSEREIRSRIATTNTGGRTKSS